MEFEDLDKGVQWEVRRLGAAFGIEKWTITSGDFGVGVKHRHENNNRFHYVGLGKDGRWTVFLIDQVKPVADECKVSLYNGKWFCMLATSPTHNELMARGLFRLGFEDAGVFAQLPELTTHEKLELRLSLPREFWPPKWLDEEAAQALSV